MGIRQPGMHRREADFGAIPDKQEAEGYFGQGRIEFPTMSSQILPVEGLCAAHSKNLRIVDENRAQ